MWKGYYLIAAVLLIACSRNENVEWRPTIQPTATLMPDTVLAELAPFETTAVPTPDTSTPAAPTPDFSNVRVGLAADTAVPTEIVAAVQKITQQNLVAYKWVDDSEAAGLRLSVNEGQPLAQWVYALAAPFDTVTDGLTLVELQTIWQGSNSSVPVWATEATAAAMTPILGQPGTAVQIVPEAELGEMLWGQRPSFTILPFHHLTPDLKLLQLDGISPLAHEFEADAYPLTMTVGVVGEETAVSQFQTLWNGTASNRDSQKLTRVAVTGVTALVRATAFNMEQYGILWPGEEVGPLLRSADITHISNEVSFAPDCPYPDPVGGTIFCSRDSYFDLIQDMGVDVIELTGNHQNDRGRANFVRSLEMYETAGWRIYGGGRNVAEAAQPALFEHNGNKIAFVGCNSFGPAFAWATETEAGAMPCDGSLPGQIAQLRAEGYEVIATLQYTEFYHYAATAGQAADFQALAEAGATAVSGSQGHHAQGFDFYEGAFIHYGLGNLFFDQMDMLGTRQTFVDTYVFYDGRLLSVELWTGLIEQYARPRVMTVAEREQALTAVFQASDLP
ncbi:MAG: hypothetical protein GY796_08935 [Chloroflexi bacterium]|nr:hypothetical protein [Chloroflexota bacterium]